VDFRKSWPCVPRNESQSNISYRPPPPPLTTSSADCKTPLPSAATSRYRPLSQYDSISVQHALRRLDLNDSNATTTTSRRVNELSTCRPLRSSDSIISPDSGSVPGPSVTSPGSSATGPGPCPSVTGLSATGRKGRYRGGQLSRLSKYTYYANVTFANGAVAASSGINKLVGNCKHPSCTPSAVSIFSNRRTCEDRNDGCETMKESCCDASNNYSFQCHTENFKNQNSGKSLALDSTCDIGNNLSMQSNGCNSDFRNSNICIIQSHVIDIPCNLGILDDSNTTINLTNSSDISRGRGDVDVCSSNLNKMCCSTASSNFEELCSSGYGSDISYGCDRACESSISSSVYSDDSNMVSSITGNSSSTTECLLSMHQVPLTICSDPDIQSESQPSHVCSLLRQKEQERCDDDSVTLVTREEATTHTVVKRKYSQLGCLFDCFYFSIDIINTIIIIN